MTFDDILDQVLALLRREGRVSYRALKLRFNLDDDYIEGPQQYYDPDQPSGAFATWPSWPNLMNAAQAQFTATGLDMPHYVTFGNHDALVQGNAAANASYEAVATGCVKPLTPFVADPGSFGSALEAIAGLDLAGILSLVGTDPTMIALVPEPSSTAARITCREHAGGSDRARD